MTQIVLTELKSKKGYLGIKESQIEEGLVGEKEEEVFNVTDAFIRFYAAQQQTDQDYQSSFNESRIAGLLVLCGAKRGNKLDSSKDAYALAEKIERALLDANIGLWRESEPIFAVKNSDGISIFAVSFFFQYESAAGDPNG